MAFGRAPERQVVTKPWGDPLEGRTWDKTPVSLKIAWLGLGRIATASPVRVAHGDQGFVESPSSAICASPAGDQTLSSCLLGRPGPWRLAIGLAVQCTSSIIVALGRDGNAAAIPRAWGYAPPANGDSERQPDENSAPSDLT